MNNPLNQIKKILKEKVIKQTWLEKMYKKSFCRVNSYVCNNRQSSLNVLFKIAEIPNVEPKELFANK